MALDIAMHWDNDLLEGDIAYADGDLEREPGLTTAVLVSLFTDARAAADDVPLSPGRRGWWGDSVPAGNGYQIGSRLWLLDGKATQNNVNLCKSYVLEALQWMKDDGVVVDIECDVFRFGDAGNYRLGFEVRFYKSDGTTEAMTFTDLWEAMYAVQ